MGISKEFRIPLPLKLEEFQRGQLYAVSEVSKNETGGGEGAEFVKQEEFTSTTMVSGKTIKGTYTYKIYRLRSKAPWILQKTLPEEAFEVHEESWNAYPYCKTIVTNPGYMKKDFQLKIETIHQQDNGSTENALNSSTKCDHQLINICDDSFLHKKEVIPATDPKEFKSTKTGRGPLPENWITQPTVPIMCAYKLVSVHFKWRGLGGMVEKTVMKQYPRIFGKFHRESWCWVDSWIDMSMAEIRQFETETAEILKKQMAEKQKRGTTCNDTSDRKTMRA